MDEIKAAQTERRRLERKWRSSQLTVHRQMFIHQRYTTATMCKQPKETYYKDRIEACSQNQTKLHQLMDALLHQQVQITLPTHNSSLDLANQFCAFVGTKIDRLRSQLDAVIDQVNPPTQSDLHNDTSAFSFFTPVTEEEVAKMIRASPSKSCGLDPLPTWLLMSLHSLTPTITAIVNYSLDPGIFPTVFKSALVRPLPKKPTIDPEVLRNYRPVSNLAFISKVLNKVIVAQLTSRVKAHAPYENYQSAYCCHRSTETALIRYIMTFSGH